ncbi:MAG: RNA polymerase sigma factor (sigma-70 family) [Polaribacter sp.]|jgi:RNA polymerase sigma factor (sigma-70 family)
MQMQKLNWHEVYSTLSPKLLGICRRYIKDLSTAEDIVQDSFIVAIQKENDLKNKEALKGWLCRIVINRAINYLKKERIVNYTDANSIEFIDETTEMNIVAIDKKSAILASDFSHEDLLEAIDSLSENHKSVFNLYIIDEFSHIQISKLLNISVGTSKSSLSRARKNIQQFLINKLNNSKTDEKKKRRIAFLLFFGFGNHLFANYYKNSFSSFEIKPKKAFDSSKNIENLEYFFLLKNKNYYKYLKIVAFFFFMILLVLFFLKEENISVSKTEEPFVKEIQINVESEKRKDFIKENTIIEKPQLKKEELVLEIKKPQIINKVKTPKIIVAKDSIIEPENPKVVVIKKQIIKKDTIYVEKE